MIIRKVLLAVALVGALSFVGGIVAQTKKSVTIEVSAAPIVNVNQSSQCVDVVTIPVAKGDTLTWKIASGASSVTNFHIFFLKTSPFLTGQRYVDKDHSSGTLRDPQNGVVEDIEYVVSVDGGATCDPHVIIIGGKPKGKN
jgi:hypothetical protein